MAESDVKTKEIERQARRIYDLIWSNRDSEAESELRALGADAVPVARALAKGNYRWSPRAQRLMDRFMVLLLWCPVIVPTLVMLFFGTPPDYDGFVGKLLFFLGVAGGTLVFGGMFVVFCWIFLEKREFNRARERADVRKWAIACRELTRYHPDEPELLDALLDAFGARIRHWHSNPNEPAMEKEIYAALTRLLPACSGEALTKLDVTQRNVLIICLQDVRSAIQKSMSESSDAQVDDDAIATSVTLGPPLIRAFEWIPNHQALRIISDISAIDISKCSPQWSQTISAAQRCLPILEENIRRSRGKDELLRGADAASAQAGELLRSHTGENQTSEDELLRASPFVIPKER